MLRPYQTNAIEIIGKEFKSGKKRVLLVMPTGAGKTVVFCEIAKRAISKGKRVGILTRGRKLVDQASQRLFREKVSHGVMMASHWNWRPHLPVQVCSIDTLVSRELLPEMDLWILDEAHLFGPKGKSAELLSKIESFMLSVTATPYCDSGLSHLAETMIRPVSMQELIDQGYLAPFRYFAPSEPDMSGIKIDSHSGDYNVAQTEERMATGLLTGRIIDHWKKIADGCPTLLFAVNVSHSKYLENKFNEAGISAEHVDAEKNDREREAVIKRSGNGKTKVICSVGVMTTGVDIPWLRAIIMARPTKSRNLFIQMAGRGTRTNEGKTHCILLDHAGNIKRHGFPTMEPEVDLEGAVKRETTNQDFKVCENCFAMYRGPICPECGVEPPQAPAPEISESDEELQEIQLTAKGPVEQWLEYLEQQREKSGRKQGWQYWKLLEKFPIEECEHLLPPWFLYRLRLKTENNPFAESPFSRAPRQE